MTLKMLDSKLFTRKWLIFLHRALKDERLGSFFKKMHLSSSAALKSLRLRRSLNFIHDKNTSSLIEK